MQDFEAAQPQQVQPVRENSDRGMISKLVQRYFQQLKAGTLRMHLPDGQTDVFGGQLPGPTAEMRVTDWNFFRRCAFNGDIGFGESWMEGEWTTNDLPAVLSFFVANMPHADDRKIWTSRIVRMLERCRHWMNKNTLLGSRKNISAHYDLSNDFFRLFLDETMTYSSAFFNSAQDSLQQAQLNKIHRLLSKAHLEPYHHLLEIGSGWGALSIEAVKKYGCRVTTITLSAEQKKIVEERIAAEGLSDRIDVQLTDYREVQGKFDRVISVEMLEAVGHEYLPTYFGTIDKLLNPNGLAVIQVITLPDQRYDDYRRFPDWIQKYIFPGAVCPSLLAMQDAMKSGSSLFVENLENIGPHYAETLRRWRLAFMERLAEVAKLGFDDKFCRMWEYYLAYCEVGFRMRILNTLQLVLTRQMNTSLPEIGGQK